MSEEIKETPTGELEQGEFKLKKKRGRPKKLTPKQETTKLDLSKKEEPKKEEDAVSIGETKEILVGESTGSSEAAVVQDKPAAEEKVQESEVKQEEIKPVATITEITDEVKEEKEVIEEIKEEIKENPKLELPENIEKLVDFMKDTGGTVEDYVRLNADYSNICEEALLNEYYKKTRPHLDPEEVKFLMEDKFIYDEDLDEDRDIRKKLSLIHI